MVFTAILLQQINISSIFFLLFQGNTSLKRLWVCVVKSCRAKIIENKDYTGVVSENAVKFTIKGNHTHSAEDGSYDGVIKKCQTRVKVEIQRATTVKFGPRKNLIFVNCR